MTQEVTYYPALKSWWENAELKGKEFCQLKENGDLALKGTVNYPERVIANLTPENADAVLKALIEKFPEVEGRVNEIRAEWESTEDKLKLIGKVSRTREYLLHTNAIGDFDSLLDQVNKWDNEIAGLVEGNYKARLALVEKAEKLAAETDNWKETTQVLRDIADQWKQVGHLDKGRNDELWTRLEEARNKFFERKRVFHEEQEKEMLQNLDQKMEIVEKAENLATSENWKEATETFRQLMDQWKAIGRTPSDKNEELWNRFILSKNTFYDRKKVHFETIQAEQEVNYSAKLALVEKAESLKDSKDWNVTTQAYAAIMEEWKKTGRVPADRSDELWNRLSVAREHFFQNRRQHMEAVKVTQEDNYAQKMALLKRAETLMHSTQWRETTEEMNELMDEWKKIGPVPREHMNSIWEQFITARKSFFERKDADRERRKQHAEKQYQHRFSQTHTFLVRLEEEYKEEMDRIADFKNALENITPGNKEEELREHLNKLISQGEYKIKHKQEKIEDLRRQMSELENKNQPSAKQAEKPEKKEAGKKAKTKEEHASSNGTVDAAAEDDAKIAPEDTDQPAGAASEASAARQESDQSAETEAGPAEQ